ncbi:MAG: MtrB/PioB family outer membrane beta-barrel protein [Acidobacteria bacterium]|nr:MtrB/PioB family outer membrane beta-barrel protein [Acidobacteriota bacterium]
MKRALSQGLLAKAVITLAVAILWFGSLSGSAHQGVKQQLVICAKCNVAVSLKTSDGKIRTRCPNCWEKLDNLRCPRCGRATQLKAEIGQEQMVCQTDGASLIVTEAKPLPSEKKTSTLFQAEIAPAQRSAATSGAKIKAGEYKVLDPGTETAASFTFQKGKTHIAAKSLRRSDEDQDHTLLIDLARRLLLDLKQGSVLHRLDHDPLSNLGITLNGTLNFTDANPGRDYQVVRSELTPDLRIAIPGVPHVQFIIRDRYLTRRGHEQARTIAHCTTCHVQADTRRVDQSMNELELGGEAKCGPLALYYGRTVRKFKERGEAPRWTYPDPPYLAAPFFRVTGEQPFAFIPDSTKRTDRIELRWDLSKDTRVYAGATSARAENQFTGNAVDLVGSNLRITMRPLSRLRTTVRYQFYEVNPTLGDSIDRTIHTGGVDATYQFARYTSVEGGYELERIRRPNVLFRRLGLDGPFERGPWNTSKQGWKLGLVLRPLSTLDVSARYKFQLIDRPLTRIGKQDSFAPMVGRRPFPRVPGLYPDLTNQPTQVQDGFLSINWRATKTLALSPVYRFSDYRNTHVDRHERDHLLTLTATYAPLERLNITSTYTYERSRTAANLFFGSTGGLRNLGQGWVDVDFGTPYRSRVQAWLAGINWMPTRRISVVANYRLMPTRARFDSAIVPDIGQFSALRITTQSAHTGFDYAIKSGLSLSASYMFEDYADREFQPNSGRINLFRFRLSWTFLEPRRPGG